MKNTDKSVSQQKSDQIKLMSEKTAIIHLVKGEIEGKSVWAYLAVTPSKYDDFMTQHAQQKNYDMCDYGDILHSGYGDEPSAEDVQYMVNEFNIIPDIEKQIIETVDKMISTPPKQFKP